MASTFSLKRKKNIVKEFVQKQESWAFRDTKCSVYKKTTFNWNNLSQAFQSNEFQVILPDDPSTKLRKGIYKNISRFELY